MLSWTSWRRKQLFLSYIQLVRSRADVRGRGLQRAVVLTLSSRGNELHIVVALKQQKSCSITIKTRNKKTYIPDTVFLQRLHNLSMCVGSLMHVPDARLPHCTPEQRYLFVASADVYLCQWRIKLPAVWSTYFWIKVHCRCVGSVRIWLNRSCVFETDGRGSPRAARHDFEVTELFASGCWKRLFFFLLSGTLKP